MPKQTFPLEATLERSPGQVHVHIVPTATPARTLCNQAVTPTPPDALFAGHFPQSGEIICPACKVVLSRDHQSSFRYPTRTVAPPPHEVSDARD
jgi:hypothetical protein